MPTGEFYIEGKKEKATLAGIEAKLDKLLVLQRSEQSGDKVMTAGYEVVYEQSDDAAYIFSGAKINLTPMQAGDAIDIRVRTKQEEGGAYVVLDEKSFSGVQPASKKAIRITAMPDKYGFEISMRQTAGVLRVIPCEFFDAKRWESLGVM